MKRQTVIVIITPAKTECWGNFKKPCIAIRDMRMLKT